MNSTGAIMQNQKKKIFMTLIIVCLIPWTSIDSCADIVVFKDGRKLQGTVSQNSEGIWVEGMLFERDEIADIKKAPIQQEPVKKNWFENVLYRMNIRKSPEDKVKYRREKAVKEYNKRIKKKTAVTSDSRATRKDRKSKTQQRQVSKRVEKPTPSKAKATLKHKYQKEPKGSY